MKASDFVSLIEDKYFEAKGRRISRMSVEWGGWSREMNLQLREQIESGDDPEELRLRYVFVLWTVRSQLLELHYQSPYFKMRTRKQLSKECRELKEMILTGEGLEDIEDLTALAQRIIK